MTHLPTIRAPAQTYFAPESTRRHSQNSAPQILRRLPCSRPLPHASRETSSSQMPTHASPTHQLPSGCPNSAPPPLQTHPPKSRTHSLETVSSFLPSSQLRTPRPLPRCQSHLHSLRYPQHPGGTIRSPSVPSPKRRIRAPSTGALSCSIAISALLRLSSLSQRL